MEPDFSIFEILNRYKESPEPPTTTDRSNINYNDRALSKGIDGLSINVGPDVARWVVLLIVVLVLVLVILKLKEKSKASKRMKKIEKELIRLRRNTGAINENST